MEQLFLPRDAIHKRGLCRHALSVRLSVCHVREFCQTTAVIVSSKFFSPSGSQAILVFHTKCHRNIPTGTPRTGASNAGGVGTNRDSGRIAGYRSMTAAVRDQQLTVVRGVVCNNYGARLFTAQIATHQ